MDRDILQYFRTLDDMIGDQVVGQMLIPNAAYFDTTTVINDTVTLFSLDALGGACSEIVAHFWLILDGAATFQFDWYVNTVDAPATFTVQLIPAITPIATPAANGNYHYQFPGILAQGLVLEGRIAQDNAGNATNAIDGYLAYLA